MPFDIYHVFQSKVEQIKLVKGLYNFQRVKFKEPTSNLNKIVHQDATSQDMSTNVAAPISYT